MTTTDELRSARSAFERRAWSEAYEGLTTADAAAPLEIDDVERLAVSSYLTGRDEESADAWTRAHGEWLRRNDVGRAARCTFWLVIDLVNRGEQARASGWLGRTQRLLDEAGIDCAERGLMLVLTARTHVRRGDFAAAFEAVTRAVTMADRFGDIELGIFARLAFAQVKARRGEVAAAVALFDEIMVAVTADPVSPIAVGVVYCAVVDTCQSVFEIGRAREWTQELARWCAAQPDLVPFRGQCLVHRAEIMRLSGAWEAAIVEAEHACRWLADSASERDGGTAATALPSFKYPIGPAFYQLGEVHRLRGEFGAAESAYRRASEHGRSPQPGLALMRLAQGRLDEADAAIRRLLDERERPVVRAAVLAAAVDVFVAIRDLEGARAAAAELSSMADGSSAKYLHALAAQAAGSVLLADGDARAALASLRDAWMGWQETELPYDAARTRVLRALACRALGDEAASALEFDAAERVFERLAAAPDVARVAALRGSRQKSGARALSPREREVIALVATGMTNQAIAGELGISTRTVDRHVSNIFTKLDLSSRSAATAYAYEHGLIEPPSGRTS